MAYGTTYITTQGAILAAKTLQGKKMRFSKFVCGDGELTDESVSNIKTLTNLINPIKSFSITNIKRDTETQLTVSRTLQKY